VKTLCLFLILASASAFACTTNTGSLTSGTIPWNNLTRNYDLYLPNNNSGPCPTVLWVMLHPTSSQQLGNGNDFELGPMEQLANTNNFIVVWPIATQSPIAISQTTHKCTFSIYWEPFALSYIWGETSPPCGTMPDPDDSGFIRSLISTMRTTYGINTVYVAGMSSGAFMAHRVGIDSTNDLIPVSAVGAASGQIYAVEHGTTFNMHKPSSQSVAVVMLNGDADPTVPYCGQQNGTGWGNSDFPKSDVSLDYWANANNPSGCNPVLPHLCNSDGTVNTQVTTYSCGNVTFQREGGVAHTWVTGTESRMWTFFTRGVLPPPPPRGGLDQPFVNSQE
jgi:poly(3-hydroxybutyrate) depolymerase